MERFSDTDRIEIAKNFVQEILSLELPKPQILALQKILETKDWRAFEKYLEDKTDGWIHGWDQYIYDEAWEYARDWLTNNPHITITEEFEGCGDCAICAAMKNNVSDTKKLLEAFKTEVVMQSVAAQLASQSDNKIARKPQTKSESVKPTKALVFKVTLNGSSPRI